MKRKKRLEKGIESLKRQIEIHEEKLEGTKKIGDEELARYYMGEIEHLKNRGEDRKEKLKRKN